MGCNLRHQTGEQGVMQDTVLLLVSLADCKEKCKALLASQGLVQLLQVANVPDSIPATSKRGLMKALVLLGSAQEDKATREAYWGQVLTPLEEMLEKGSVSDGTVAAAPGKQKELWQLRERIAEALLKDGYCYKYDISLPLSVFYDSVTV